MQPEGWLAGGVGSINFSRAVLTGIESAKFTLVWGHQQEVRDSTEDPLALAEERRIKQW